MLETKERNMNARPPQRHTRESGYPVGAGLKPALHLDSKSPPAFAGFARNDSRRISRN